jgi:AraC-like DNA-binding protein
VATHQREGSYAARSCSDARTQDLTPIAHPNRFERLADGERNIAALAVEVGFAHHSHFAARFHNSVFGVTPAQAREMLTKRKLNDLRTLLERAPDA